MIIFPQVLETNGSFANTGYPVASVNCKSGKPLVLQIASILRSASSPEAVFDHNFVECELAWFGPGIFGALADRDHRAQRRSLGREMIEILLDHRPQRLLDVADFPLFVRAGLVGTPRFAADIGRVRRLEFRCFLKRAPFASRSRLSKK
jgi:hypothetical protein